MYSVYKNSHNLAEPIVAALFAVGFLSGAISATFTGGLADRYGRKRACVVYCLLYSISCSSVLFSSLPVLFSGRILGGISTTLLFSVFETWMIAEYHRLAFVSAEGSLSTMFEAMSTSNGITAIVCGIISQALVVTSRSEKAPFVASIVCLVLAAQLIKRSWVGHRVALSRSGLCADSLTG